MEGHAAWAAEARMTMSEKKELKDRVEARRKRLEARISELKADSRAQAREERDKLQKKLDGIKSATSEGWENLSDKAAARLNELLKD